MNLRPRTTIAELRQRKGLDPYTEEVPENPLKARTPQTQQLIDGAPLDELRKIKPNPIRGMRGQRLFTPEQVEQLRAFKTNYPQYSLIKVAKVLGVDSSRLYKILKEDTK